MTVGRKPTMVNVRGYIGDDKYHHHGVSREPFLSFVHSSYKYNFSIADDFIRFTHTHASSVVSSFS